MMGFPKGHFTHIIVDEAAQAAEPDVMIPISFLDKTSGQIILAGKFSELSSIIEITEDFILANDEQIVQHRFFSTYLSKVVLCLQVLYVINFSGDPMQLGPVVLCRIAAQCGLSESYLERLINRFPYTRDPEGFPDTLGYDPKLVTKLVYNYRALPDILGLYSQLFYNGELIDTVSILFFVNHFTYICFSPDKFTYRQFFQSECIV